ncbi:MAG: DUF58 domain-containing protein [Halobacteriales archaeon]|nr:DUF58 domain-containing protein [Halobacteriales archaeon]
MRPTRRGYVVVAAVLVAAASASLFGARGLNAVAGPGVVALGYAAFSVWRVDEPTVRRELPERGVQGGSVTVTLTLDVDRPYSARLTDAVGDGLIATGNDRPVTVGGDPVRYELSLRRRGDREVGPATVEARDVLGLVSTSFTVEGTDTVLVRPPAYPLAGARADELVWTFGGGDDRREFDFLRHYRRGDPLRDIHWPSSAKVPDEGLVVKHFSADEDASSVRVAGESEVGHADQMAAATASIAAHLLTAGLRVELAVSDTTLDARGGHEQRDRVLDALGRTRGGTLREGDRQGADVLISARESGVTVRVADAVSRFNEVAGREISVPPRDEADAGLVERLGGLA